MAVSNRRPNKTIAGADQALTQVTRLLHLGDTAELFHTPDGEGYATILVKDHKENWPIRSKEFRKWLGYQYYQETRSAPKSQALQETLATLESKANFDGAECAVSLRIAGKDDKIYIDLGDSEWRVVQIDSTGWGFVPDSPVKFRRSRGMRHLPEPVHGGRIAELQRFLNIAQSDWILLIACVTAAFLPQGPYPVVAFYGEQGSAKSTLTRVVRELIDPNLADLRCEPRDARDLMITAHNGRIVCLDNLSRIPDWLSDAFCRLSTGGGFSTRELYSDTDETLLELQRPVILNGIAELASRGDLIDRSVIFCLPTIYETDRRSEQEFWTDFEAARSRLLGALLDVVSAGLKQMPKIKLAKSPRMADFTGERR